MHSPRRSAAAAAALLPLLAVITWTSPAPGTAAAPPQSLRPAYRADFDVTPIRATGHPDNRYDIVIAGEGYAADDISGFFAPVADRLAECFLTPGQFDREPYLRYREFINVHRLDALSNDSGADTPTVDRDSARSSSGGVVDRESIMEQSTRRAGFTPDARLANAARGIGTAYTNWGESYDACEPALHESAHGWHSLGDEFAIQYTAKPCVEPPNPNLTIETDPQRVKWRRWLGFQPSGDTTLGAIGIYGLADTCVKRPIAGLGKSRMWADGPFTAIDKEAIIRSIYRAVRPIDIAAPTEGTPTDPKLWVRVVDPDVVKVAWTVADANGVTVGSGVGEVLDTASLRLPKGSYRVTARAYDEAVDHAFSDRSPATIDGAVQGSAHPLDVVRDPQLLSAMQQSITWNVTLSGATVAAMVVVNPPPITLTADRSAGRGSTVGWLAIAGTGTSRVVGLPPAFRVGNAGQVVVADSAWLRAAAIGSRMLTVTSLDPVTGVSTTQALTLVVTDHWLNTIDDTFGDGTVDIDLTGGRGFRRFDGETGGSVTESGGSLHLAAADNVTASARSIGTVDMHRGGLDVTWSIAPPTLGSGGSVELGIADNVVGVNVTGSSLGRGVRLVIGATGSLAVDATVAPGVVTRVATTSVAFAAPATDVMLGIDVTADRLAYTVRVGSAEVLSGPLPDSMLQRVAGVDDGPWGRKTQTVTMRAAGVASLDVAAVKALARSAWVRPIVTFPIGSQTAQQGQPYRFDMSRFVFESRIRFFTFAVVGLPPGLAVNGRGLLTGTPTTVGTYSVGLSITLPDGDKAYLSFAIRVVAAASSSVTVPVPTVHFRLDGDAFESGGLIGGDSWARSSAAVGTPVYANGRNGSALSSSPTGGVLLRSHAGLYTGDASTYAMWLKADASPSAKATFPLVRQYARNRLTIRFVPATGTTAAAALQMTHQSSSYPDAPPTPQPFASAGGNVPSFYDGNWHLVTGVFDGHTLTLYVDGNKIASASAEGRAVTLSRDGGDLEIGGRPDSFSGLVDDVQVWDTALTPTQVAVLAGMPA